MLSPYCLIPGDYIEIRIVPAMRKATGCRYEKTDTYQQEESLFINAFL